MQAFKQTIVNGIEMVIHYIWKINIRKAGALNYILCRHLLEDQKNKSTDIFCSTETRKQTKTWEDFDHHNLAPSAIHLNGKDMRAHG